MSEGKWVPVEPTPEMIRKGLNAFDFARRIGMPEYDSTDAIEMMWNAMLSAALASPPPAAVKPSVATIDRITGTKAPPPAQEPYFSAEEKERLRRHERRNPHEKDPE